MHEERMHAMGVLASGVAHDLNHALNVIALRVATLRADSQMARSRRTLDVLARVVGDAARIVARLQDLARKRRDRPHDALDLAAVLTGAIEMARTEADTANVRIEADVPPLPLVRGSAAELAHVFGSLLLHAREQMPEGGRVQVKARVDAENQAAIDAQKAAQARAKAEADSANEAAIALRKGLPTPTPLPPSPKGSPASRFEVTPMASWRIVCPIRRERRACTRLSADRPSVRDGSARWAGFRSDSPPPAAYTGVTRESGRRVEFGRGTASARPRSTWALAVKATL